MHWPCTAITNTSPAIKNSNHYTTDSQFSLFHSHSSKQEAWISECIQNKQKLFCTFSLFPTITVLVTSLINSSCHMIRAELTTRVKSQHYWKRLLWWYNYFSSPMFLFLALSHTHTDSLSLFLSVSLFHQSLSTSLSTCLLFICFSPSPSLCLPVCLSFSIPISLSVYLSFTLQPRLFVCLSFCL